MFVVTMKSEEYGYEEFEYDSLLEAQGGLTRLVNKCISLHDGVERWFNIEERVQCTEEG